MAQCVDGYVILIGKQSVTVYRRSARFGCKVRLEHGALEDREPVGAWGHVRRPVTENGGSRWLGPFQRSNCLIQFHRIGT